MELSKPVRKRYRCGCVDPENKLWWVLKYTYKFDPETKRTTEIPRIYQIQSGLYWSAARVKYCPDCGIKLPEPTETLPEEKKNGRKSRNTKDA